MSVVRLTGVVVVDYQADEGYVTPEESATEDDVYVSRIRTDPTVEKARNVGRLG